ncbi:hypothetical protein [Nostoc sp. TCL240-02]|uniref:hypothetical protein n=1 Tax=Nostoc sp. TCL240-02 TaxID=2572090 RepID=UPI00157FA951|nr:hypothetical protein [Nostoc sp. TCL240-02]QKQ76358.1 hypothetical protein FBB35_26475 [Nostoc sp. TCL240-02]
MSRSVRISGVKFSETQIIAGQMTDYDDPYLLATALLAAIKVDNIHEYQVLKRKISVKWSLTLSTVSELCIITRQITFFFDEYDTRSIG